MGDAVRRHLPGAHYCELEPADEHDDDAFESLLARAREAERLVVAVVVRPAAWRAFGLAARERRLVDRLLELRPTTLVALGSPRGLEGHRGAEAEICSYSDVPSSQRAVVELLAGR
jgi:hypothetical protein